MISILTPTYNRAYTLRRLFESLIAQDEQHFEWIVIDDGSTDETRTLLAEMADNSLLNMSVVSQANGGKHVAINTGVGIAKGDWIFIVDSDDILTPNAISKIMLSIEMYDGSDVVGVCYRKASFGLALIGADISPALGDMSFMHPTEAGQFYQGDLAYIFKRDALLTHPFPVFKNETFVPELLVWNEIGDHGRIAYYHHDVVYLCEYLPDGLSANFFNNLKQNPGAFKDFYQRQFFREQSLLRKLKCAIRFLQCLYFSVLRGAAQ